MSDRLSPEAALIDVMVVVSAADRRMSDDELKTIGSLVQSLPAFRDFDIEQLLPTAEACATMLASERGLDGVLQRVSQALPESLRETAYLLAVEIAMADGGHAAPEVVRLLELIRYALHVDRLVAAAIERAARARFTSH
jgi:tellurite resistance protein